jgi:hypothetical protein
MPTLKAQTLSGLVVIPTVEHEGVTYRVSLGIDVGASRSGAGAAQVVTREDLIVELRNSSDGSLEPIGSPDPGPLPTHALRIVQARGDFTFGQGVNPPEEVVVTVRGDRKSFPMDGTFAATPCLGREPDEGHGFPGHRPTDGILDRIRLLPGQLLPFRRRGCCPRGFEAPQNPSVDAAAKSEHFEMEAEFKSHGSKCRCACCEYRQFVRGRFTDAAGAAVRFDMPSGPLDPARYCEDGAVDEFGPGRHGYYGHRPTSSPGDEYTAPDARNGCVYRADETVSCPPTDGAHLEFLGLVIDRCGGRVAAKRTWVVDL